MERVLITGASGCIGQAAIAWLRARGVDDIVGITRTGKCEGVECVASDVADRAGIGAAVRNIAPSRIIHLAAFQTPDCEAQPFRGMEINVSGTRNLLRAAAELGETLKRFVFASSAAVYGSRDLYLAGTVTEDDPCRPPHLYGFWKIAGEGMTQAFHRETRVPAIALRLATTYGPGRDRGLTAAPTTAIKAAALGVPFAIPYSGREHYHYVEDAGAGFGACATEEFSGYGVFNLRGVTTQVEDFVELLREAAGGAAVSVAENADAFPFVCDLDDAKIVKAFPGLPLTGLQEGIRKSLDAFRRQVNAGELTVEQLRC